MAVQGYANAVGDSLVMAPAPASAGLGLVAVGVAVVAVLGLIGYLAVKRGVRPKTTLLQ